jgi:hypothetical protein
MLKIFSMRHLIAYVTSIFNPSENYKILKGSHQSLGNRKLKAENLKSFKLYVDSSWIHTEVNAGWNKLIGISDGFHHQNSARLVWRCIDGKEITFAMYTYYNSRWNAKVFEGRFKPGDWVNVSITAGNEYKIKLNDETFTHKRKKALINYILYPYFGGKDKAPHDMVFKFRF